METSNIDNSKYKERVSYRAKAGHKEDADWFAAISDWDTLKIKNLLDKGYDPSGYVRGNPQGTDPNINLCLMALNKNKELGRVIN